MDSRQEEKLIGLLHSRGAALAGAVFFALLSALLLRAALNEAVLFFEAAFGVFACLCALSALLLAFGAVRFRTKRAALSGPSAPETISREDVLSPEAAETPPENEADLRCQRLFEAARSDAEGESTSVRLQVKVRAVEKLRKLLQKSRISEAQYALWRRRIMDL